MFMQYMQYFANLKINSIWISNISIQFWQLSIPIISKGWVLSDSVVDGALNYQKLISNNSSNIWLLNIEKESFSLNIAKRQSQFKPWRNKN